MLVGAAALQGQEVTPAGKRRTGVKRDSYLTSGIQPINMTFNSGKINQKNRHRKASTGVFGNLLDLLDAEGKKMHRKQGGARVYVGSGLLGSKQNQNADMAYF